MTTTINTDSAAGGKEPGAKIIPMPVAPRRVGAKAGEGKWGKEVWSLGFTQVPSLLLHGQRRLGLSSNQLCVLLQLADYWWEPGRKPYPKKQAIADRVGLSTRQVQRIIAELEKGGLVTRVERMTRHGKTSNEYDLAGLVKALARIAPEFQQARKEAQAARERREGVALPPHRRKDASP